MGPGGEAEGGVDAGADVLFGAFEFVNGSCIKCRGEDFSAFAKKRRCEFFGGAGVDFNAVLGPGGLYVRDVDAGTGIEVAALQSIGDGGRGERRGTDHDPTAAWIGVLLASPFEDVGIVNTDAVEALAAGEEFVPHLIERGGTAPPVVVHGGVAVVDLKELETFDGHHVAGGDGPVEIGVIDGGEGLGGADEVDVALNGGGDGIAVLGLEFAVEVEGVDVDGAFEVLVGDLFGRDDEELFAGAVDGVEGSDVGEVVVVGQGEELVAVLAVPGGDFGGGGIAVAIDGVGVEISFVPAGFARFPWGGGPG